MAGLYLVNPDPDENPLTLQELLDHFAPDKLNAIDARARLMRERFTCPLTVRNYDEFKDTLIRFYAHYQTTFYGAEFTRVTNDEIWSGLACNFFERHLGGYLGLLRAERNAIAGREGGMISIIDNLTDEIIKLHTEQYIRNIFFDLIAPGDYDTRLRLANELLARYGQYLFPGERLLPYYHIGMNLEAFIQGFVTHLHALRREWRY